MVWDANLSERSNIYSPCEPASALYPACARRKMVVDNHSARRAGHVPTDDRPRVSSHRSLHPFCASLRNARGDPMATAVAGSYNGPQLPRLGRRRKCAPSPLSSLEHSSKLLGMSPNMEAYDTGVFTGLGTDTLDSWSQLRKCLALSHPLSQGNLSLLSTVTQSPREMQPICRCMSSLQ